MLNDVNDRIIKTLGRCGTMYDYVGLWSQAWASRPSKILRLWSIKIRSIGPSVLGVSSWVSWLSWVSWYVELYLDWTRRGDAPMVNGNSRSILKRCGAMTTAFRSVQKLIFEAARRTVPKKANMLWSTAFKTRLAERNIMQHYKICQPSKQMKRMKWMKWMKWMHHYTVDRRVLFRMYHACAPRAPLQFRHGWATVAPWRKVGSKLGRRMSPLTNHVQKYSKISYILYHINS